MYPEALELLIEALQKLPGVGYKTAERYALSLLDLSREEVDFFAQAITDSKDKIHFCAQCGNYTTSKYCSICMDQTRDSSTICVISTVKELIAIEKLGQYKGVYHVLNGLLSPIKGILPEDINMNDLFERIDDQTREVILALNATIEGEMTSMYIKGKLETKVKVSRLAFGLSTGGNLDYADDMTLMKAFEGRK